MNQDIQPRSAKIYQFPLGRVRAGVAGNSASRPFSAVKSETAWSDFGSGWYHEAAIEEEARRKAKP